MNLSGKAVKYWMDKEKIDLQNLLVIVDDLGLPLSKIRIRRIHMCSGRRKFSFRQHDRVKYGLYSRIQCIED